MKIEIEASKWGSGDNPTLTYVTVKPNKLLWWRMAIRLAAHKVTRAIPYQITELSPPSKDKRVHGYWNYRVYTRVYDD